MTKKKPPRTPAPASSTPLIVVRDWLRAEAKAGHATSCPCCEQTVKIYPRKLSNATARALIKLWRLDEGIDSIKPEFREDADPTDPCTRPWTRLPKMLDDMTGTPAHGGESTNGHWWDLIERRPGLRPDSSDRSGWWRLTDLGVLFVLGKAKVKQTAYIYNSKRLGFDGPDWGIKDALGKAFDYDELMGRK